MREGALYDIFILDIEMSEMTGVELARKIQEIYGIAHIIFTTCHVRYAPQGYEVRAERFVLKDRLEQKKHSAAVEKIYPEDQNKDLLSGNAGLMIAWLHMYDVTGDRKYLERSVDIWHRLEICMIRKNDTAGCIIANETHPLAGLSHGNSGFLLAFSRLYKRYLDDRLAGQIRELLAYEDCLFDPGTGNWLDLRSQPGSKLANHKPDEKRSPAALKHLNDALGWCHGAPGILLARLELKKNCPELERAIVDEDIARAMDKLSGNIYRPGFCLCHGNFGNSRIALKGIASAAEERHKRHLPGSDTGLEIQAAAAWQFYKRTKEEVLFKIVHGGLLPQERYNPGFMTGLSGIGYSLLQYCAPKLPDILALEL